MTGSGLDDLGIGVRILVRKYFSPLYVVQTGSEAHRTFYPMGTVDSFSGGKEAGA
jgi:hypothetical protein